MPSVFIFAFFMIFYLLTCGRIQVQIIVENRSDDYLALDKQLLHVTSDDVDAHSHTGKQHFLVVV